MATSGSRSQWPKRSSLQGSLSNSPTGAQSMMLRSEKECRSSFPMGQRPKDPYLRASSYLLQQLIHRYQESDADGDDSQGEEEVESEESSESEMQNLEVCLPSPTPHSFLQSWGPAPLLLQQQLPDTPLTRSRVSQPIPWALASRSASSWPLRGSPSFSPISVT